MPNWNRILGFAGTGAIALAFAAPSAVKADIFAWRTEDGVFAYTDDRDNIPDRYAHEAVSVRDSRLAAYPRLTVEDSAATRAVATRLEKRLDYLRQVNAPALAANAGDPGAAGGRTVVSVATGSSQVPTLDIATDEGEGPIVVEPILTKQSNHVRTRRTTIVKQGDRTLAVVKGVSHEIDVNSDIHDEDRLVDE